VAVCYNARLDRTKIEYSKIKYNKITHHTK